MAELSEADKFLQKILGEAAPGYSPLREKQRELFQNLPPAQALHTGEIATGAHVTVSHADLPAAYTNPADTIVDVWPDEEPMHG